MHIFFQNNQYLGSYYFTRSADDPVGDIKYLLCPGGVPGWDLRAVLHAAERHGALHPAHAGPVQGQPTHLAPARRHQEEGDGG